MERIIARGDKTYRYTLAPADPRSEQMQFDPELARALDAIFATDEGLFDQSRYNPYLLPEGDPLLAIYQRLDDHYEQYLYYTERAMRRRLEEMGDREFIDVLEKYYWRDRANINWILHDMLVEEEVLTDMPVYTIERAGETVGLANIKAIPAFVSEEQGRIYLEYLKEHTVWKEAEVVQRYRLDQLLRLLHGRADLILWENIVLDDKKNIDAKRSRALRFERL